MSVLTCPCGTRLAAYHGRFLYPVPDQPLCLLRNFQIVNVIEVDRQRHDFLFSRINQELPHANYLRVNVDQQSLRHVPIKRIGRAASKRSTQDQTLALLHEGQTVEEIAQTRQLSKTTIYGHFAYLIKAEKIELEDVMEQKRIRELADLFDNYQGASLTPLKEKLGDKVTWDELKLYQASTLR